VKLGGITLFMGILVQIVKKTKEIIQSRDKMNRCKLCDGSGLIIVCDSFVYPCPCQLHVKKGYEETSS